MVERGQDSDTVNRWCREEGMMIGGRLVNPAIDAIKKVGEAFDTAVDVDAPTLNSLSGIASRWKPA